MAKFHLRYAQYYRPIFYGETQREVQKSQLRCNHTTIHTLYWSLSKASRFARPSTTDSVLLEHGLESPTCNYNRCSTHAHTSRGLDQYLWQTEMKEQSLIANDRRKYETNCRQVCHPPRLNINYGYCALPKARERHIQRFPTTNTPAYRRRDESSLGWSWSWCVGGRG